MAKPGKKVMAKVKVFQKKVKLQGQGHEVTNLLCHVKGLVTRNIHVQYESPITSSKKVMAKVKVFVHADADTDAEAHTRAMTLAPRTFVPVR